MYFNLKHLKEAKIKAGKPNAGYWWHFRLAMNEAFFLLAVTIGSVIHAVFPWVLDFKLLEWRINRLKVLKEMLPDDPQLKRYTLMNYNFLNNSQFVIVDYTPGSSGQLFLRLWAELDSRLDYNDEKILSKSINNNVSSTEIAYRIPVTKKIVNWFLEKTAPVSADDYLTFFEYLGNFIVAQPWSKESKIKYYENGKDIIYPSIILYAMHTKDKLIPKEVKALAPNLEILSIVPTTDRGKQYQLDRAIACYNQRKEEWPQMISQFNNKDHFETFDFCSMLVDNDTDCILKYLEEKIGQEFFLNEKLDKARLILNTYYSVVVNNLESINV